MRSPPRSPRPSARPSAPRCQRTQADLAREAATREDCCGRERGPGDVEGGREGGRGGRTRVTVRTAGTADLQAWSHVLPQCCRSASCLCVRRPALFVFSIYLYRTRTAYTTREGRTHHNPYHSFLPFDFTAACGRALRAPAASACLSVRSTPPSSFGSSRVAACTATGGNGAVSK